MCQNGRNYFYVAITANSQIDYLRKQLSLQGFTNGGKVLRAPKATAIALNAVPLRLSCE
jgi:hypothetical protein